MRKFSLALSLALLFAVQASFGQTAEKTHSLDATLTKCMEANGSTTGMVACMGNAEKVWDAELNKYYKQLLAELDTAGQQSLREAQRVWLSYKAKETALVMKLYAGNEGTMWNIVIANRQLEITRQRALELRGYYETMTQR